MKENGIFSALDLAKYLNYLHNEKKGCNISPLKLQKVLFFLFGEWGAFISNSKKSKGDWSNLTRYRKYLFNEDIEAWLYGPVVREVYNKFNNETLSDDKLFHTEEEKYARDFINDLANELFNLSDFRLVELSHELKCWQSNFLENEPIHNNVIDKEQIISEFLLQI